MAKAACQLSLGEIDECERVVGEVLATDEDRPRANLYMGMIWFRRGDTDKALEYLRRAEAADARMPGIHTEIGAVLLVRQEWELARKSFERAIEINADDAEAWDGAGVAYRALGKPKDAVFAHMRSIALLHYRPRTHIHLAMALGEVGRLRWAAEALKVAIGMEPENARAHALLADLLERGLKRPEKAAEHRRKAEELRAKRSAGRENSQETGTVGGAPDGGGEPTA
jgi:tetratricopeptide (TPR) repeat protein